MCVAPSLSRHIGCPEWIYRNSSRPRFRTPTLQVDDGKSAYVAISCPADPAADQIVPVLLAPTPYPYADHHADTGAHGDRAAAPARALSGGRLLGRACSAQPRSSEASLPAEVEGLLIELVDDGFAVYRCGHRAAPHALVASYDWGDCLDLVTIRDFETITTARVPHHGKVDVFAPKVVIWAYEGPPQHALRALLTLVHPAHPAAPRTHYPAPPRLYISRAEQRPMTIRLASPERVGARAARLAAAVPTSAPAGVSPTVTG